MRCGDGVGLGLEPGLPGRDLVADALVPHPLPATAEGLGPAAEVLEHGESANRFFPVV
ncbi:hypothetical protein ACWCOV_35670 [Kribbella sp. NPDC002412]